MLEVRNIKLIKKKAVQCFSSNFLRTDGRTVKSKFVSALN
jgi:hypothetical protein